MCPKIRCDGKSEKFYKIFWEINGTFVCLALCPYGNVYFITFLLPQVETVTG
jgi:hypothetical protein